MDRALRLAAGAYGSTSPNPLVGAVLVRRGIVVGEGVHRSAGASHAEREALDRARAADEITSSTGRDLTLYVNLEPCCHQGRTPPCVDGILEAPIGRIVAAMIDPNPLVSGRGAARLRAAGIEVEIGCRWHEAAELNHMFVARQRRGRPFVALKVALSADGCIAAADGSQVPITGIEARRHAHRLRAGHDAILVGVETLRRDRPRLDSRLYHGPGRAPRRLVLDPGLRAEPEWLWPGEEPRPVLLCSRPALEARGARLEGKADLVALPQGRGGLDLEALPAVLARLELWSLLVEGGGRTHGAFLAAGLWDRVYVYRNPGLRLAGLGWTAAAEWERAAEEARRGGSVHLGDDGLEVFVHRGADLPAVVQ